MITFDTCSHSALFLHALTIYVLLLIDELCYSVGGPPGQPPRHMTLPSGNVTTPAAIAVPPSLRVGFPSILTFLPMNSSTFQPAFFSFVAPVQALMRQDST